MAVDSLRRRLDDLISEKQNLEWDLNEKAAWLRDNPLPREPDEQYSLQKKSAQVVVNYLQNRIRSIQVDIQKIQTELNLQPRADGLEP
ncbi:MAG: hypothetical protein ACE5KO_04665 [Candidatus Bathyarchaeia archaeon]